MPKIKYEKTLLIGSGKVTWYMKAQRWAKKQKFPISFLLLGIIEWLKKLWIDVKIYNTMKDVDRQTDELLQSWKEQNENRITWRQEYLEMKAGLSKLQIRLLEEGPHQLAQAWLLLSLIHI